MNKRILILTVVATGVLGVAAISAAQPAAPSAPPAWSGKAELSFVAATGNSETETLGVGGELEHQPDGWDQLVRMGFVRSADAGDVKAKSLSGLARASHRVSPRVEGFGELDFLSNRLAGIVARSDVTAGLTYLLIPAPGLHTLRVFASGGYVREVRVVGDETSSATASVGARYRWRLSSGAEVTDEVAVTDTPAVNGDWRAAQNLSVSAQVASKLSLKLSQRVEYVRAPVPGFRSTDTLTSAALVVKF